jgi:hypothetical protein
MTSHKSKSAALDDFEFARVVAISYLAKRDIYDDGYISVDDLQQVILEALLIAKKSFDPSKGEWSAYRSKRALGAIIDHIRKVRKFRSPCSGKKGYGRQIFYIPLSHLLTASGGGKDESSSDPLDHTLVLKDPSIDVEEEVLKHTNSDLEDVKEKIRKKLIPQIRSALFVEIILKFVEDPT